MAAILTDSHLETRIKSCILMNVIAIKVEYAGGVWEGNAKLVNQLKTVQRTAAKKILGCSSTTSDTVLRVDLGMHPLKTNRGTRKLRKLKWQYKVRNMLKERWPAIFDGAVWEKVTKERAGIRWGSVVGMVWKDIEGIQEVVTSAGEVGRHQAEVEENIERRERLALRNEVKLGKQL